MDDKERNILEYSIAVNGLLKQIENGILLQQKFHSVSSYELRTLLSTVRGTLEVLVRHRRDISVYEKNVKEVIRHVDSVISLLEDIFLLDWLHSDAMIVNNDVVNLRCLVSILEDKWLNMLYERNLSLQINIPPDQEIITDCYLLDLILDKLISSSIRHSRKWSNIVIAWNSENSALQIYDPQFGPHPSSASTITDYLYEFSSPEGIPTELDNRLIAAIISKAASLLKLQLTLTSTGHNNPSFTLGFLP